jgi:hypothetical protein
MDVIQTLTSNRILSARALPVSSRFLWFVIAGGIIEFR